MEAQTIICQNCQTPNPATNLYCQSCGKPLVQVVLPPVMPSNANVSPEPVLPVVGHGAPVQPSASTPVAPIPAQPVAPSQEQGWQGAPQQGAPQQGYRPQDMPPQKQAVYPPPPPPVRTSPTLEQLGAWKDGWADLVPGEASKAAEVEREFVESLKSRDIPMVMVEKVEFSSKFNKNEYLVVRNPGGAVTVQINHRGNDLSLNWALYTKHVPNWRMIAILVAIAFLASFLNSLGTFNFGIFFVNWVFGTLSWLMPVAVLALIAGYVWKGSFWYFFLENVGEIANEELTLLTLAVHQSILSAVSKVGVDAGSLRQKFSFRTAISQRRI